MVAYADAGTRPNPGWGGFGIHAYVYATGVTLKGVGLGNIVTSNQGYVPKDETTALVGLSTTEEVAKKLNNSNKYQVVPEHYVDYFSTLPGDRLTNNFCEMHAAKKAIEIAIQKDVKHLQIYSDSELTCKGINNNLDKWSKNGWLRADGLPIKNVEVWQQIKELVDFVRGTGMTFKIDWVRGHNGDIGNELADQLATMAVMQSQMGREVHRDIISPNDGYWKPQVDRHPMVTSPKLYFNTSDRGSTPGTYYIGHHGKDDDQLGNRSSDSHVAVVRLVEPVNVIETMRELQAMYNSKSDRLYQMFLDRIFMPDHYRFLISHKEMAVQQPQGYRMDLNFVDGPPLTREFKPALISGRVVDDVTLLDDLLQKFKDKDSYITAINLTDILYDRTPKVQKKKEIEEGKPVEMEYTLKKEFNVGIPSFDVMIPNPFYPDLEFKLTVTVGLDILERNSLKRLEEMQPDVNLIIWKEGDQSFRFATVIQGQGCEGIWAAPVSNLRIVLNPELQAKADANKLAREIKKHKKVAETLEPAVDMTMADEETA